MIGKGIGTVAVWLGPVLAVWITGDSLVAWAFVMSFFGTLAIWGE